MKTKTEQSVCVVDDDESVRDSLHQLLQAAGLNARPFMSAEAFLDSYRPGACGCLLLDINLPSKSGFSVQEELLAVGSILPIIFITGHPDVPSAVKALKAGAFDYLQKPFNATTLLEVVHRALELHAQKRVTLRQQTAIQQRLAHLTPRESEVLAHVIRGEPSKVIARELELSPRTVDIYRANIMQKMRAGSIAQLVKMTCELPEGRAIAQEPRQDGHG